MASALQGKRILVTRPTGQNKPFTAELSALGAAPIEFPTIQIVPPQNSGPLNKAIGNLGNYHWLILTSANGVEYFFTALWRKRKMVSDLAHLQIAAVGPATARALTNRRAVVSLIPNTHTAEGLLAAMPSVDGLNVLYPTTRRARPVLQAGLTAQGATVTRVDAYETALVTDPGNLPHLLTSLDVLTFTSASTAQGFVGLLTQAQLAYVQANCTVACIGPIAAQAAETAGLPVHIVPQTYTIPGLIAALDEFFSRG